jgi:2-oxo-3-hexenedioate decarboxylase
MVDIAAIAAGLDEAATGAVAIPQITGRTGALSLADAYAIQRAVIARRLARGATLVGVKMGFTSEAKMAQMGLTDQIWGRLTSDMVVRNGGTIDAGRFIHPRLSAM